MHVLARFAGPQSQHRQLKLIHSSEQPCTSEKSLCGGGAPFGPRPFTRLILMLSLQLDWFIWTAITTNTKIDPNRGRVGGGGLHSVHH